MLGSTQHHPQPDGTSATVQIDRRKAFVRYRYTCPEGHVNWDQTNNHIWCPTCRQQLENGHDVDPEHYHIVDQKTGLDIDWADVELVGGQ